jgi:hypothetical protein
VNDNPRPADVPDGDNRAAALTLRDDLRGVFGALGMPHSEALRFADRTYERVVRPVLDEQRRANERLTRDLEDVRTDKRTAEMQRDDYRTAHRTAVEERDEQRQRADHFAEKRLTIAIDEDTAEAVEFTHGMIVAFWAGAQQLYAWANLDALREQWPDATLTWIDEETP